MDFENIADLKKIPQLTWIHVGDVSINLSVISIFPALLSPLGDSCFIF
ncbi:hypothetical Protein YC6258_04211 [Gynuella sunshinyii YC6258]|uniref:Uncharacterized protein n=1 Tax=Gynuella sunshinyii YC6258 TaxID=1445510 RepID=A0A0C5VAB6_9GAMM|nr:hypothetical Protein YC6258_04211 [Gynuella sunshinyii YC6258]